MNPKSIAFLLLSRIRGYKRTTYLYKVHPTSHLLLLQYLQKLSFGKVEATVCPGAQQVVAVHLTLLPGEAEAWVRGYLLAVPNLFSASYLVRNVLLPHPRHLLSTSTSLLVIARLPHFSLLQLLASDLCDVYCAFRSGIPHIRFSQAQSVLIVSK